MTIDWEAIASSRIDVDVYEAGREQETRKLVELGISETKRRRVLALVGVSDVEMARQCAVIRHIQESRRVAAGIDAGCSSTPTDAPVRSKTQRVGGGKLPRIFAWLLRLH